MIPKRRQREAVARYNRLVRCHHAPKNAVRMVAREFGTSTRSVYRFRQRLRRA